LRRCSGATTATFVDFVRETLTAASALDLTAGFAAVELFAGAGFFATLAFAGAAAFATVPLAWVTGLATVDRLPFLASVIASS
jgi:hypothetical protein